VTAEPDPEGLQGMRARVDDAYAAADRLVREAEKVARGTAAGVPPNGWGVPGTEQRFPDLAPLLALVEGMRQGLPPELAQRFAEALRELLLAVRALVDWWIERLERRAEPPAEVEDIPID
jgi:hypothetical protein